MNFGSKLIIIKNNISLLLRLLTITILITITIFLELHPLWITFNLILIGPEISKFYYWIFQDRKLVNKTFEIINYKIRREERYYKFDLNEGIENLKVVSPMIPNAYKQSKDPRPNLNKNHLTINDLSGKIFWEEITSNDFVEFKNDKHSINVKTKINDLPGKFIINITLKNNLSVSQLLIFDEIKLYCIDGNLTANNGRRYKLKIPANEYEERKYVFHIGIGIGKIQNAIIKFKGKYDKKPFNEEIEISNM